VAVIKFVVGRYCDSLQSTGLVYSVQYVIGIFVEITFPALGEWMAEWCPSCGSGFSIGKWKHLSNIARLACILNAVFGLLF